MPTYLSELSLICGFCPSDQRFAYSFFQILSHDKHPCCSAIHFPLSGHVRDLHPLEFTHAGQTEKGTLKFQRSTGGGHGPYAACFAICRPAPSLPFRLGPRPTQQSTGLSRFTGMPFRVRVPADLYSFKKTHARFGRVFFWRRTWDSNPRGCYALLAFQASSLATRSILHDCPKHLKTLSAINNLPQKKELCKYKLPF